jgi:hypothetical protein
VSAPLHLGGKKGGDEARADAALAADNGDHLLHAGSGVQGFQKAFRLPLGAVGTAARAIMTAFTHFFFYPFVFDLSAVQVLS